MRRLERPGCDASLNCLVLFYFEKTWTEPSDAFIYKLLYNYWKFLMRPNEEVRRHRSLGLLSLGIPIFNRKKNCKFEHAQMSSENVFFRLLELGWCVNFWRQKFVLMNLLALAEKDVWHSVSITFAVRSHNSNMHLNSIGISWVSFTLFMTALLRCLRQHV